MAETSSGPALLQIQGALDEVAAACRATCRPDLLGRLKEEADQRRSPLATVVVVGEIKRGKSSLINSLLSCPELSPVDVDVATGCQIFFHYAPTLTAYVQIGADEPTPIPLDDLPEWVTVEGNPGNGKRVGAAYVGVPSPLLQQLTIVDTPGVGGLEGVHGELALQSAAQADLLLFAAEAGAALSEPELRFLARAADRLQNIVIAITKVDVNPGWGQIIDDDRRLLQQHAPRFAQAPLLPVSSRLALVAEMADGSVDDELMAESGLPALTEALQDRVAGRSQHLRLGNLIRVAQTAVEQLSSSARGQLAAIEDDTPQHVKTLQEEQQRLEQLQSSGSVWPRRLEDGLRRIALDRADELSRAFRELRVRYDTDIPAFRGPQLDQVPQQLLMEVTQLAMDIAERTSDRIDRLARGLADELEAEADIASLKQLSTGDPDRDISLAVPSPRKATRVEQLSTLVSFSSGRSIGSLVAGLPILALGGIAFTVVGAGIGGLFAWQMHRGRNDVNRQTELRSWMREQLAEGERQLNNDFTRRMIDVQNELRAALSSWISVRMAQVSDALKASRAVMAADRTSREKMLTSVRAEVDRLAALHQLLEGLQQQLQGPPIPDTAHV